MRPFHHSPAVPRYLARQAAQEAADKAALAQQAADAKAAADAAAQQAATAQGMAGGAQSLAGSAMQKASAAATPEHVAAVAAIVPLVAESAPPAVRDASVVGASKRVAREDHTHKSSVAATRIQVTGAAGRAVWTFPVPPYTVPPVVTATAETPDGAAYINVATVIEGATTTSSATIVVQRIGRNQTVVGGLSNLVSGIVMTLFNVAPAGVYVNCVARPQSQG